MRQTVEVVSNKSISNDGKVSSGRITNVDKSGISVWTIPADSVPHCDMKVFDSL